MQLRLIHFISILLTIQFSYAYEGVFWHICDLHLNITFNSDINNGFGTYDKDSSISLIKSTLQFMKTIYARPDFIIVNGDETNHGFLSNNKFEKTMKTVANQLHSDFPLANVLPALGNHDVNPANLFDPNSEYCSKLFDIWSVFFQDQNQFDVDSFKKGCYYSRLIPSKKGSVMILVLNTMLWYKENKFTIDMVDPLDQFTWLKSKLLQARTMESTKVFLVAHAPPGAAEYSPRKYHHLHKSYNTKFIKIMQDYSDIIDAGFFAHQHTDSFKIVYNSFDSPIIPLLLSPSISPYHLWGLGSVNPSVRLYSWNNTNSQSKYSQYHTYLNSSFIYNDTKLLNWTLEYNSTSLLPGLSAVDYHKLLADLSNAKSNNFDKFFLYHLSGRDHEYGSCPVNSQCRCNIICGMKEIDYTKLNQCLNVCGSRNSNKILLILSIVFLCLLIFSLLCFGLYKFLIHKRRLYSRLAFEKY